MRYDCLQELLDLSANVVSFNNARAAANRGGEEDEEEEEEGGSRRGVRRGVKRKGGRGNNRGNQSGGGSGAVEAMIRVLGSMPRDLDKVCGSLALTLVSSSSSSSSSAKGMEHDRPLAHETVAHSPSQTHKVGRMVTSLILLLETLRLSSSLASIIQESKASSDLLVAIREACGNAEVDKMALLIESLIDKETLQGKTAREGYIEANAS